MNIVALINIIAIINSKIDEYNCLDIIIYNPEKGAVVFHRGIFSKYKTLNRLPRINLRCLYLSFEQWLWNIIRTWQGFFTINLPRVLKVKMTNFSTPTISWRTIKASSRLLCNGWTRFIINASWDPMYFACTSQRSSTLQFLMALGVSCLVSAYTVPFLIILMSSFWKPSPI